MLENESARFYGAIHRLRPPLVIEVLDTALRDFGSSDEELLEHPLQWGWRHDFIAGAHTPCIVACHGDR